MTKINLRIAVLTAMAGFVNALGTITKFFADNPKAIDGLLVGMTALAAGFAALGTVAVVAVLGMLAPGGALIVGLAGLAGALAALAALNWSKIQSTIDFLNKIGGVLRSIEAWSSAQGKGGVIPYLSDKFLHPFGGPEKQSFLGESPFSGALVLPANFSPGEKKQILQPIQMNLNVDGRMLAQTVSEVVEDLYEHPTSPPQASGWDHFRSQANFTDT